MGALMTTVLTTAAAAPPLLTAVHAISGDGEW